MEKYMKKIMSAMFLFSICALISGLCGCKKRPSKKTAKTVEQEIDIQTAEVNKAAASEVQEISGKAIADAEFDDLEELE